MTSELDVSHFRDFFRAVNGPDKSGKRLDPFPWQEALVAEVARSGSWPDLLDLPTAAGKTAVIDAAVFLHALNSEFPRRIVFVIDRRVVVQQAAERASKLAQKLKHPDDPIVRLVADRLRKKVNPDPTDKGLTEPLYCAELRGGIARDESWTLRPDVPTVIVSTVDQVGSRLLFRGYGVSDRMRPVHAGLLANDVLLLLDEVHLSRPFASTLRAISASFRREGTGVPRRWQVVELSATPERTQERAVFTLSERDKNPESAPLLHKRISAEKYASKHLASGRGARKLAKDAAEHALKMAVDWPGTVVGVLVNRVNTARLVEAQLKPHADSIDTCLITGRMRPFDRDDVLRTFENRIKTGRERTDTDKPLVVIGTQSLEAGADFDFDALVTECASYDALKQRFGRVDRNGDLSFAGHHSRSIILADLEDIKRRDDPVYGAALAETWSLLPDGQFNFAAWKVDDSAVAKIIAPTRDAPVLLPSHLDRWVQTSPAPDADPDIAQWLHGLTDPAPADVNVVWRADLTPEMFTSLDAADLADLVSACRPGPGEQMQVPLAAVRAWLGDGAEHVVPVADVEGVETGTADSQGTDAIRPVLRWLGDASEVAAKADDIHPGDTIVVPSVYGGVAAANWAADSVEPVSDLGHQVQVVQRQRAVLRLSPQFFPGSEIPRPELADADPYAPDDRTLVATWLRNTSSDEHLTGELIKWLGDQDREGLRVHRTAAGTVFTVTSVKRLSSLEVRRMTDSLYEQVESGVESEPERSSFTGRTVPLTFHLRNVADWAKFLATACDVTERANDLWLAGLLHDLGKADPRFQEILRNDRALGDELLAKSGQKDLTPSERERIRQQADYPSGGGHELLSVALIQEAPTIMIGAADEDLVLHLVASHHGACRPFAPVIDDPRPVPVRVSIDGLTLEHSSASGMARLDSGVADRFWRLVRRYGWFELTYLECLLRLADHRASEQEQL